MVDIPSKDGHLWLIYLVKMVMFHSYVSFRGILVYKGLWDVKGTIKDRCTTWENDKYYFKEPWIEEMSRVQFLHKSS